MFCVIISDMIHTQCYHIALQLKNESESSSSERGSPLCAEPNDRNVDEHLTKGLERKVKEGVAEKSKPPQ